MTLTLSNAAVSPATWKGTTTIWVNAIPAPAPPTPGVSISKSAEPNPVPPGGLLTYTLSVTNSGAVAATNLVISDTVPTTTTFQSCSGADLCAQTSGVVTWNLAALGTGQTRPLNLVVRVDASAPISSVITNSTYSVHTGEGASAVGTPLDTLVGISNVLVYLPLLFKG